MRFRTALLLGLVFLPGLLFAQYRWDFGFSMGGANYLGEMGGNDKPRKDFVWDVKMMQSKGSCGAFMRYRLMPKIALHTGVNYFRIAGADSLSTYGPRRGRNLSFRNDVYEFTLRGEYYFYQVNDVGRTGRYRLDMKAYLFAGLAGFYHNPQTYWTDSWVNLQPLNTEALPKPYSKFGASIPIGVGFFYTYLKRHRFGWEFGWRTTSTDYMDDVSGRYADPDDLSDPLAIALADRHNELPQHVKDIVPGANNYGYKGYRNPRGDPSHNDSYILTQFTYSYSLRGKSSFTKSRYNYVTGGKRSRKRTRAKF